MPEYVRTIHILSSPNSAWQGSKGYVTTDFIQREAGKQLEKAHLFLCGPPAMMEKVLESLKELGVAGNRIHYERFSL